ncbi:MAG: regulatory protein RecX, partial [Bdellovibrionota bacterium]
MVSRRKMEQTPSEKNPLDYALNRVSVREYSASEMKRYLKRKGFSEEQCQSTLAELLERGLIDDRRYAGAVARSQLARGKGPRYIQAKLMSKGVRIDAREA